jgi:hypothetical protein
LPQIDHDLQGPDEVNDHWRWSPHTDAHNFMPANITDERLPLLIFKKGATTGLTAGLLVDVNYHHKPKGLRNLLAIESLADRSGLPFAREGDSGSLVFVSINNKIVPIGIFIGWSAENRYFACRFDTLVMKQKKQRRGDGRGKLLLWSQCIEANR